ncbi:unnamed protein product [Rodentolepis nana]|uniref:Ovule protein n=1 Tax=Rodentolepis nana TaxID=102285 RepID=A0A0R3TVF3_RODNA|nr:unnamed protein product [Rodentolepis nana]
MIRMLKKLPVPFISFCCKWKQMNASSTTKHGTIRSIKIPNILYDPGSQITV